MFSEEIIPILMVIVWVIFIATMFYGWIINILKLVGMDTSFSVELFLRAIGVIFFPLGSVMGIFI